MHMHTGFFFKYFWKKKNQLSKTTSGSIVKKKKKNNSKASCKRKAENIRSKISGIQCYCITYLTAARCAGIYFLYYVFPCLTG